MTEHLARPGELAALRGEVRAWLAGRGLAHQRAEDLVLAVSEAAADAVENAYRGLQAGTILVRGRVEPSGEVVMTVRDTGRWREPHGVRDGTSLLRALCAEVSVEPRWPGTLVTLRQPLRGTSG